MALRYEHGRLRPQPPRRKDLPKRLTAREPDGNRDSRGRFTARNRAACGKGAKAAIKKHLGTDATTPEIEALYRETRTLFTAFMRTLPSDEPQIAELVARQARSAALSARYAAQAAVLGLDTDAGRKALDMSIKLDQRAERLAVTAIDLAQRAASDSGGLTTDAHMALLAQFSTKPLPPKDPNG